MRCTYIQLEYLINFQFHITLPTIQETNRINRFVYHFVPQIGQVIYMSVARLCVGTLMSYDYKIR